MTDFHLSGRIACLLGRHAWEYARYWQVGDPETLVEGPVCARCQVCSLKNRRVIQRLYRDAARRMRDQENA